MIQNTNQPGVVHGNLELKGFKSISTPPPSLHVSNPGAEPSITIIIKAKLWFDVSRGSCLWLFLQACSHLAAVASRWSESAVTHILLSDMENVKIVGTFILHQWTSAIKTGEWHLRKSRRSRKNIFGRVVIEMKVFFISLMITVVWVRSTCSSRSRLRLMYYWGHLRPIIWRIIIQRTGSLSAKPLLDLTPPALPRVVAQPRIALESS